MAKKSVAPVVKVTEEAKEEFRLFTRIESSDHVFPMAEGVSFKIRPMSPNERAKYESITAEHEKATSIEKTLLSMGLTWSDVDTDGKEGDELHKAEMSWMEANNRHGMLEAELVTEFQRRFSDVIRPCVESMTINGIEKPMTDELYGKLAMTIKTWLAGEAYKESYLSKEEVLGFW